MEFSREQIVSSVVNYFKSDHWQSFMKELSRGLVVRHAHIYLSSCLNPFDLAKIIEAYFEGINLPVERAIRILPIKPELLNVYNIKPKGMAHFEFFLTYDSDVILAPASSENSREGTSMAFWDDDYMKEYFKKYKFREAGQIEIEQIKEYFKSREWKEVLYTMTDLYAGVIHSHGLIETSIHPEVLLPYAVKSLEEMGIKIGRALAVVYSCFGRDVGKLTFLLNSPEVVLELEWFYNPNVVIRPAIPNVFQIATEEMLEKFMAKYERINIAKDVQKEIISSFIW